MQNLQHYFLLGFFDFFLFWEKETAAANTMSLQRLDPFFEVLQDYTPSIPGVGLMDVLIF